MAELKVGGLALIISCPWGENAGRVVRLLRYLGVRKSDVTPEVGQAWEVKSESGLTSPYGTYHVCGVFSRRLMPIDGDDFQREDERQKELTHG